MKRIIWLLMLVFCMQTAFAESAPADGLYTIGVSSSSKMFKVMDCILRVEDGKMTAVLTMSGSGYGYLYQGTSAEADAAPVENWTPYFENADGKHRFAIEIPALDEEIPMASWSIRYEKWYDRSLQFFSDTLKPYQEIAPDGVYSAEIISDTGLNGATAILYSKDGEMTLETDNLSMELLSLDIGIDDIHQVEHRRHAGGLHTGSDHRRSGWLDTSRDLDRQVHIIRGKEAAQTRRKPAPIGCLADGFHSSSQHGCMQLGAAWFIAAGQNSAVYRYVHHLMVGSLLQMPCKRG